MAKPWRNITTIWLDKKNCVFVFISVNLTGDSTLAKAFADGVNGVFQLNHVVFGRIEQIELLAIAVGQASRGHADATNRRYSIPVCIEQIKQLLVDEV